MQAPWCYQSPVHDDIALDGPEFFRKPGSDAVSTGQDRNVLLEERFKSSAVFLHNCEKDCLDNVYCREYERFEIIRAWLNRMPEGDHQRMHCHGNSIVSGVYGKP